MNQDQTFAIRLLFIENQDSIIFPPILVANKINVRNNCKLKEDLEYYRHTHALRIRQGLMYPEQYDKVIYRINLDEVPQFNAKVASERTFWLSLVYGSAMYNRICLYSAKLRHKFFFCSCAKITPEEDDKMFPFTQDRDYDKFTLLCEECMLYAERFAFKLETMAFTHGDNFHRYISASSDFLDTDRCNKMKQVHKLTLTYTGDGIITSDTRVVYKFVALSATKRGRRLNESSSLTFSLLSFYNWGIYMTYGSKRKHDESPRRIKKPKNSALHQTSTQLFEVNGNTFIMPLQQMNENCEPPPCSSQNHMEQAMICSDLDHLSDNLLPPLIHWNDAERVNDAEYPNEDTTAAAFLVDLNQPTIISSDVGCMEDENCANSPAISDVENCPNIDTPKYPPISDIGSMMDENYPNMDTPKYSPISDVGEENCAVNEHRLSADKYIRTCIEISNYECIRYLKPDHIQRFIYTLENKFFRYGSNFNYLIIIITEESERKLYLTGNSDQIDSCVCKLFKSFHID